jgi:glycosyltransferase involved in cell wall biosynthesis
VTDGATYYTSDDIDLSFMLTSFFTGKYSIICQGNNQYHRPQNRDKAIELFQNAQRVFFVSERNRQECFHQLATKFENTSIIQNPINIPENINYKIPKNKDEIHIAIVGRLNISDKGQDTVIKMLDDDFWKKSNYKFHIYGDGIDKEYLEDLINFYNVSKLINIEGSSDLQTIWNKCHILLMPSLIEGTSLTMLEALLIGRVCIISNVGGASEWIKDGQNGFLIDFPTPASIEKKLKDVLEGQDCWIEICKNARASTLEKIDNNPGKTLFERLTVL